MAVAAIDEATIGEVLVGLGPLAQQLGVAVLVTDDLHRSQMVTEHRGLDHQRGLVHLRRWVGRALPARRAELPEEWPAVLDPVAELGRRLPADGAGVLVHRWQRLTQQGRAHRTKHTAREQLRRLIWRRHHRWADDRRGLTQLDIPLPNNGTEQAIGRFKVRSRRMRGFKAWSGVEATVLLTTQLAAEPSTKTDTCVSQLRPPLMLQRPRVTYH